MSLGLCALSTNNARVCSSRNSRAHQDPPFMLDIRVLNKGHTQPRGMQSTAYTHWQNDFHVSSATWR